MSKDLEFLTMGEKERPNALVVVLHGITSNFEDWKPFGERLLTRLPDAQVLIPNAPHHTIVGNNDVKKAIEHNPTFDPQKARSWFPTGLLAWPSLSLRMKFNQFDVANKVNRLIDQQLDRYGLNDRQLAFMGMSQGSVVGTYAALQRAQPCAAVVSHSGMYFGIGPVKAQPPTLMLTGAEDDVTMTNKSWLKGRLCSHAAAVARLTARHVPVESYVCPKLGHLITPESADIAIDFIVKALTGKSRPEPAPFTRQEFAGMIHG